MKTIRGTRDILPGEMGKWHYLEEIARSVFGRYGFQELRTPLFEATELFARAVGETTDIVEKEMYTFDSRGGESLTLRPEGTASVVRSFNENGMSRSLPWRVYYMGPMFRYERPQKGRQRQFHQTGCELFGPSGPTADVEMMAMAMRFFADAGLKEKVVLEINSLGCETCRPGYRETLLAFLQERTDALCGNCNERIGRNPLRVLDCKAEGCKAVAREAPVMSGHLCGDCDAHFDGLKGGLDALEIPFVHNPMMVRGLDYYNRTAFEITTTALGAQNAVAAGGRYDGLVQEMGAKQGVPAIGFAMGMERLALLMDDAKGEIRGPRVYIVAVGPDSERMGLQAAEMLRGRGIATELNQQGSSMKSQMKKAGKSGADFTLIIGDAEVQEGVVTVKEMETGEQQRLAPIDAALLLAERLNIQA